ncbi:MAG: hypothetical protein IT462_00235 [Planctomycetes bacterium]|nr:hypothetical protein [Planctomycetota bacterium]
MLPGTENQPVTPAKPAWILWIGVVVAAIAGFGAYWGMFSWRLGSMQRVSIDREMAVDLKPGNYTIYHETRSVVGGKPISGAPENSRELTLWSSEGERVLHNTGRDGYDFGDYAGEAMYTVQVGAAGRYATARRDHGGVLHFSNASTAYAFDSWPVSPALSAILAGFGMAAFIFGGALATYRRNLRAWKAQLGLELASWAQKQGS